MCARLHAAEEEIRRTGHKEAGDHGVSEQGGPRRIGRTHECPGQDYLGRAEQYRGDCHQPEHARVECIARVVVRCAAQRGLEGNVEHFEQRGRNQHPDHHPEKRPRPDGAEAP